MDIQQEQLIPCNGLLGPFGKVSKATVWRWRTQGLPNVRGKKVKLESVRLGKRVMTSQEAVLRFALALNAT
jgi:hypothetical protein